MMRQLSLVVGFVASLMMVGCSAPQLPPPAPGSDSSAASQPRPGGQLNFAIPRDPFDYDVTYAATGSPAGYAIGFESLLGFKSGPSVEYADLALTPKLAEKWQVSPDARSFTFTLRKGVKFANLAPVNGRALSSKDVKWSYEYSSRSGEFRDKKLPASTNGFMFEGLESVDTPDEGTVTLHFKEPFVPFLSYAASAWNPIMPLEIYQQDGNFKDRIIGTGPFQLDAAASQKGSRWSWKKNPTYWADGPPYLDEVRWLVIPDESTMFAAFQTKQVDILEELAYSNYQEVAGKSPQIGSYRYLQPRGYFLYLSQAKGGPLTDVRVRRAIAMTVDRDAISQVAAGGQGVWSLPGATPSLFSDAEAHSLQKRDPAEAKRLLAEAGFSSGLDLKILSPSDDSAVNHAWVQAVQAQLKDVGVRLTLDLQDKATVSARKRQGDYNLDYSISLGQFEADVDSMVVAFRSGTGLNWPRINDPQLDELLDGQRREVDPDKRRELLRKVVLRIVDQAWGISLIYPPKWSVWQSYVHNYRPNFGVKVQYPQAWLNK